MVLILDIVNPKQSPVGGPFRYGLMSGALVMGLLAVGSYVTDYLQSARGPQIGTLDGTQDIPALINYTVVRRARNVGVPAWQEEKYSLLDADWKGYSATLVEFVDSALPEHFHAQAAEFIEDYAPRKTVSGETEKPFDLLHHNLAREEIPQIVYQTGKMPISPDENSFLRQNPAATYKFFDDHALEEFARHYLWGSYMGHIWDILERIVLKTDVWRYMVLFWEGGTYSDMDTICLKALDKWGTLDVHALELESENMAEVLSAPPQLIVGIEFDVPDLTGWETFWPRPIQIVQWTFSAAPGHPVLLDSMRRSVEAMERVEDWHAQKRNEASEIVSQLMHKDTTLKSRIKLLDRLSDILGGDVFDVANGGIMPLLEATGPPVFTDAVFSYLQARYGIHWSQLHDIGTATRIGDVLVLPITGFAPFERSDWPRWKGVETGPMSVVGDINDPQAMVLHLFDGSWRTSQDDAIN